MLISYIFKTTLLCARIVCLCHTQIHISHAIEIGKKRDLHKTSVRTRTHQKLLFSEDEKREEKKTNAQIYMRTASETNETKRDVKTTTTKMMTTSTTTAAAASRLLE